VANHRKAAPQFDASFGLAEHVMRVIGLGRALLHQAAGYMGCTDPDDFSTATVAMDIDTYKAVNGIFASASTQLASLSKFQEQVLRADRVQKQEAALIEVLREASPELAERFLALYEESLKDAPQG
jgi:hypothetical protein